MKKTKQNKISQHEIMETKLAAENQIKNDQLSKYCLSIYRY